jgi:hypothetical protein
MFILAEGRSYARLRFNVGPGGELKIPVDVDFNTPFPGSDFTAWETEYQTNIASGSFFRPWPAEALGAGNLRHACRSEEEWQRELAAMDFIERRQYAEELSQWPDFEAAESEVLHE